jgi:hypothetical protein
VNFKLSRPCPPARRRAWHHARASTCRLGSPWPARRDRLVPVGPRAVGPICVEPTLPALSLAATRRVPTRWTAAPPRRHWLGRRRTRLPIPHCTQPCHRPYPDPAVLVCKEPPNATRPDIKGWRRPSSCEHPSPAAVTIVDRRRAPRSARACGQLSTPNASSRTQ